MSFKLRRPCQHCPFRTDVPGYLRAERAAEIARSLAEGAIFPCHETTVEVEEEDGDGGDLVAGPDSQFCAGALLCMEKMGTPNQAMRTAERLSLYEHGRLDRRSPVVESLVAFVDHHGDQEETECCHVVNGDCEAPAGYMVEGMVIGAVAEGEVHDCPECGEPVCDSCSNDDGVCAYCEPEIE